MSQKRIVSVVALGLSLLLIGNTSFSADTKSNGKSQAATKSQSPKAPNNSSQAAASTTSVAPTSTSSNAPAKNNTVGKSEVAKQAEASVTTTTTTAQSKKPSQVNLAAKTLRKVATVPPSACTPASEVTDPCSDFIVVFQPGMSRSASRVLVSQSNGKTKREFSNIFNGALITAPLSKAQTLGKNPNVLVVEDDLNVNIDAIQSSAPWGLDRVDQRALPLSTTFDDLNNQGNGTSIFVVDTGIDASNIDFTGRVKSGFTAIADSYGSADCNGHGTHVSGIAAGNVYGVAKSATLIPVRVLDCTGTGSYSNVISGLDYVASQYTSGAKFVVNMSLGGPASSTIDGAVQTLISKGINVVVAAGNSNTDACTSSPARVPEAITVGATTNLDARASYSNFGTCVDLFAPGTGITSDWLGSTGTNTISGTSMATPAVTGIVARFLAANSTLTPAQVANSVKTGATQNALTSIGTGSPNSLAYFEFAPDLTTPTTTTSPTFKKTNPVGRAKK